MNQIIVAIGCLCLVFIVPNVKSDGLSVWPEPIVEESQEIAFQKLSEMESSMKNALENLIKQALPTLIRGSSSADLSPQCMGSLLKLLTGIKDMKLWAFQMIDSTGIPLGGMLRGQGSAIGSYSQCLEIAIPGGASKNSQTGKFCVARIRPPLPPRPRIIDVFGNVFNQLNSTFKTEAMNDFVRIFFIFYDTPFKMGLCVPSACSKEEINDLSQPLFEQIGMNSDIEFCTTKEPFSLDTVQISIIGLYVVILIINIVATIWDEIMRFRDKKKEGLVRKMVQSFSIRRNIVSLVATRTPEDRSLDCMNGMRYISITWVLLGHAYFQVERNLVREAIIMSGYIKDFSFQAIGNGYISVETFFFITSVLSSYHIVKHADSGNRFSIFTIIILRILRLLPSLLLVISIVIILPAFGSGPFFQEFMGDQANLCREKWWKNALFFSNFDYLTNLCLPHGWYISSEFQCFLISLVYFVLLFKDKKWANLFLILLIVACVSSSGIVTYVLGFPPSVLAINVIDIRFSALYSKYFYILPHVHLGVSAVGLFLGTYIARNPTVKLSIWTTMMGWPIVFSSAVAIVYATYPWNKGEGFSTVEAVVYSAFQRTAWAFCLAWVVFACYVEKGGVINSFLSWPAFQPLVRLSYLIYLIHIPIYFYITNVKLGPIDATHFTYVFNFFGVLCCSHVIAFVIRILFESPISQVVALTFRRLRAPAEKPIDKLENTKC